MQPPLHFYKNAEYNYEKFMQKGKNMIDKLRQVCYNRGVGANCPKKRK